MAELKNLDDLFVHTLRRVYDAERRLTKALPRAAEAARASELKEAFEKHHHETETHVERLEQVFVLFDRTRDADTDEAVKGILRAGDAIIGLDADEPVRDAALIVAAQEAEHYEMAAYGTLREWAKLLGRPEAVQLLKRTLEEEKQADQKLTYIAHSLNSQAAAPASGR